MTIEEQIYKRFIAAVCKLKAVQIFIMALLTELSSKYLLKNVSSETKLSIKLNEIDFFIHTVIITALLEVSDTWQQFEQLSDK